MWRFEGGGTLFDNVLKGKIEIDRSVGCLKISRIFQARSTQKYQQLFSRISCVLLINRWSTHHITKNTEKLGQLRPTNLATETIINVSKVQQILTATETVGNQS